LIVRQRRCLYRGNVEKEHEQQARRVGTRTRKPRGHSVGVRFTAEVRAALDRAASAHRPSLSNLIEVAAAEWLEREGYLKK
jgi:ADP-ribose pyrophosphatase YjhB (NUDIX family)